METENGAFGTGILPQKDGTLVPEEAPQMKLVFVSNFLNHHQTPLCEEFVRLCDEFHFISCEDIANIGYQKATAAPYVVRYYLQEERELARRLICEADTVIFGACPNELIAMRMKHNKLSFLYSERFFKKGTWRRFIPRTRRAVMERAVQYRDAEMYVLSASSYLAGDLGLLGFPTRKCYRWGYFPAVHSYDVDTLMKNKREKDRIAILWVARLIPLKHPECAIQTARRLKQAGLRFQLDMVGDGVLYTQTQRLIERYGLADCVTLHGSKEQVEVRRFMEQADIFWFTSDHHEGWGAVMNESMSCGCVAIADGRIGSAGYLIQEGLTGYTYGAATQLYEHTANLIQNAFLRERIGRAACHAMQELWTPATAAQRFLHIVRDITETKESNRYLSGPCSKA